MTTERQIPAVRPREARFHEHGWTTESWHRTSEGTVVYVMCADCRARRVDVVVAGGVVPEPMSALVATPGRPRAAQAHPAQPPAHANSTSSSDVTDATPESA